MNVSESKIEKRTKFEEVMDLFGEMTDPQGPIFEAAERALFLLFREYRNHLPPLENVKDYERFHKNFRQVDVLGSATMDMVVYDLLHHSRIFWCACDEIFYGHDAYERLSSDLRNSRKRKKRIREGMPTSEPHVGFLDGDGI